MNFSRNDFEDELCLISIDCLKISVNIVLFTIVNFVHMILSSYFSSLSQKFPVKPGCQVIEFVVLSCDILHGFKKKGFWKRLSHMICSLLGQFCELYLSTCLKCDCFYSPEPFYTSSVSTLLWDSCTLQNWWISRKAHFQ